MSFLLNVGFLRNCWKSPSWRRISTFINDNENVVITDDASTIVCWHPEKPFPYDLSKPLPEEKVCSNSILKIQNSDEVYKIFKDKHPEMVRQELTKITFTTKHKWFPKARDKKKRIVERNRPYL